MVTAKATKEEQTKAVHHLLDVIQPGEPFTVVNFRDMVVPIVSLQYFRFFFKYCTNQTTWWQIDKIMNQSKLPIVVGGTNYYIESLLWKVLIANDSVSKQNVAHTATADVAEQIPQQTLPGDRIDKADTTEDKAKFNELSELAKTINMEEVEQMAPQKMHDLLSKYDVASAERLHPNNRRKIIRALEVIVNTGVTLTEHLNAQRKQPGASSLGGPLRYNNAIIFWLRCDQVTFELRKREIKLIRMVFTGNFE